MKRKQYYAYQAGRVAQQVCSKVVAQATAYTTYLRLNSAFVSKVRCRTVYCMLSRYRCLSLASEKRTEVFDQSRTSGQAYCTETYVVVTLCRALLKENNTCHPISFTILLWKSVSTVSTSRIIGNLGAYQSDTDRLGVL